MTTSPELVSPESIEHSYYADKQIRTMKVCAEALKLKTWLLVSAIIVPVTLYNDYKEERAQKLRAVYEASAKMRAEFTQIREGIEKEEAKIKQLAASFSHIQLSDDTVSKSQFRPSIESNANTEIALLK